MDQFKKSKFRVICFFHLYNYLYNYESLQSHSSHVHVHIWPSFVFLVFPVLNWVCHDFWSPVYYYHFNFCFSFCFWLLIMLLFVTPLFGLPWSLTPVSFPLCVRSLSALLKVRRIRPAPRPARYFRNTHLTPTWPPVTHLTGALSHGTDISMSPTATACHDTPDCTPRLSDMLMFRSWRRLCVKCHCQTHTVCVCGCM